MESNGVVLLLFLFFRSTLQQHQESLPLNSRAEQAALLKLRSSLGLRTKEWPIKSDPCLTWIGVLCENGSVIGINISGFKRTRLGNQNPTFSVDALSGFTALVSFNASGFSLPGSIPNWLGLKLHNLRFLDLRSCDVSGDIPSSIGNLSNLSELYLSDNNLTSSIPSSLGILSRLSVLDLSGNSLTGFIPPFWSLDNISSLDISSNYLSGIIPEDFGNLINLRYLNLSVPSEFGDLRNLQRLVIHNNNFSGDLPAGLWLLPSLSVLDASDNNFMGSLPNLSLKADTTMAAINLSHNMFYGVLTSVLNRFNSVDLSYNYLQGKIPDYACDIANLYRNCFRSWPSQRSLKECAAFYSIKGLPFDNYGLPCCTISLPLHNHKSNRMVLTLAAALGSVGLILLHVIFVILLIVCSLGKRITTQRKTGLGLATIDRTASPLGSRLNLLGLGETFAHEKILAATGDFNAEHLIKSGHSGDIFKGVLESGLQIVVKRFGAHSVKNSCMVELDFFSKASHPRLVPLLGYCLEIEKEKFIIYKYMLEGDLSSSLYRKNCSDDVRLKSLDWITRLKIAIGVAEALSYLHHECSPPLVHRDIQASSILLDDKYEVRLGSLSEACIQEGDTHSNRLTRLLRLPQKSEQGASGVATRMCSYDVYCFGKVLLELVTGKQCISRSNDSTTKELLECILSHITIDDKDLVANIIDPSLIIDDDLLEEVWAVAIVARSCLNPKPSRRPFMRSILKSLENPLKVVREEKHGVSSSMGSWSSSCRDSLGDDVAGSGSHGEGTSSSSWLRGGQNFCLTTRRRSADVFPEPMDLQDDESSDEE